jgi:alpha-beta hydrolase superfamily lysophospholipase
VLLDDLLKVRAPILIVQAERDPPLAGAWAVRDAFANARRTNLTYRELEGYDHALRDSTGRDRIRDLYTRAARWVRGLTNK